MARKKITVVGAGNVGATAAFIMASQDLGDIVLIDIEDTLPKGKALDITHALPLFESKSRVMGTDNYDETKDSDLIVITAGFPRKPGMSRDDLLARNTEIVRHVAKKAAPLSPKAVIIVVTNPLDVMTYVAQQASGFPAERVIGMAGALDSARLRAHLSEELKVEASKINAMVLGTHGDTMVVVMSQCSVNGKPLLKGMNAVRAGEIAERVRNSGAEVVGLLKAASAYVAPGACIAEMARAILNNEKKVIPCSCYLDGEYGVIGIYLGVPAILGKKGVEAIKEIELTDEEKELLKTAAYHVKDETDKAKMMIEGKI